jgi:hypothetical protein
VFGHEGVVSDVDEQLGFLKSFDRVLARDTGDELCCSHSNVSVIPVPHSYTASTRN